MSRPSIADGTSKENGCWEYKFGDSSIKEGMSFSIEDSKYFQVSTQMININRFEAKALVCCKDDAPAGVHKFTLVLSDSSTKLSEEFAQQCSKKDSEMRQR